MNRLRAPTINGQGKTAQTGPKDKKGRKVQAAHVAKEVQACGHIPAPQFRTRQKRSRSKLVRVRVVDSSSVDLGGELELEFRCGTKVRGLTLEQVAQLLGATA